MIKKNKVLIWLLLVVPIAIFMISVKADSGFDSSWDSGGSWDSGSSWGSGSSWDTGTGGSIFFFGGSSGSIITLIIVAYFIYSTIKIMKNEKNGADLYLDHTNEINDSEIIKVLGSFNKDDFFNQRYADFKIIQEAWMNFDYDLLKTKLTDEIYNQYVMQLDTLSVKNQKNIMSDFEYVDAMITGISEENNKVTLSMELITKFYDYLEEDGKVVRGNKNRKNTMHYELTFVCNKVSLNICPNCGAKLPKTNVCEYCHTTVPNVGSDWVMSKKEVKRQG